MSNPMRFLLLSAAVAVATVSSTQAQEAIEATIVEQVTIVAAKGYAEPETATVTNVRKSRARNGMGYCGEITLEEGEGTTTFHVLLETANGPSVLRLADFPDTDTSNNANAARQLLRNFGCVE